MESLPPMDDFIRYSIDQTLGLDIPDAALQSKISALEESNYRLRSQYLALKLALPDKNEAIKRARAEAEMNAQALKRFVEENHRLASECASLVSKCSNLENECSLYDKDREALMEFGNEADERAKKAECRVMELEEGLRIVSEETRFYKLKCENLAVSVSVEEGSETEQALLDALTSSLVDVDEVEEKARSFLQENKEVDVCHKLNKMWDRLRPTTQKLISLASQAYNLEREKEQLRINLNRAEEEVKLLDEENKKLLMYCQHERKSSAGKHHSSTMKKNNKRKESPTSLTPIKYNVDTLREPLSSLKENSPDLRT